MSNGNDVSGEAAAGEPSRSASAKEQQRNSFDQFRLLAALLVISGHSYPMTSHVAPMFLGRSLHILGVEIFFSISGYLIAESLIRDRNPLRFLAKRALRILPALWLATLVLLLFGLCVTSLTPIAYLTDVKTLAFLKNFVLDIHYALPGVFEGNPQGSVMNGSWWSLPYEVILYVSLLACTIIGRRWNVLIFAAGFVALTIAQQAGMVGGRLDLFLSFGSFFAAGAVMSAIKPVLRPNAFAALMALLAAVLLQNGMQHWYMPALVAYCVVSFGHEPDRMPKVSGWLGDPSYGTYIYAFAVQQTIVALYRDIDPVVLTLVASPIAVILGIISWRMVERPALALKPYASATPRRLWRQAT